MITLAELSATNIHTVLALEVSEPQRAYYPRSNAYSIAEGLFPKDEDPVWMRAICANGNPVGFMMTSEVPARGEYFLWRMMIDKESQGKGYGTAAMRVLIQRIKSSGNARVLLLSHQRENAVAAAFYRALGFRYANDNLHADELAMSLAFTK